MVNLSISGKGYKYIGKYDWALSNPDLQEKYNQRFFETYVKRKGRNKGMEVVHEDEVILKYSL